MAKKKNDNDIAYAPVKWKGHTLRVIGMAEGGMLCIDAGGSTATHPAIVYFVSQSEAEA